MSEDTRLGAARSMEVPTAGAAMGKQTAPFSCTISGHEKAVSKRDSEGWSSRARPSPLQTTTKTKSSSRWTHKRTKAALFEKTKTKISTVIEAQKSLVAADQLLALQVHEVR